MKFIAKPNTWFKAGTECKLIEYLYDSQSGKNGLFEGLRICAQDGYEGNKKAGEEYLDEEVCSYCEFEIIEECWFCGETNCKGHSETELKCDAIEWD